MTMEDLKRFGADTEDGLKRCMNNESFYLRLVCTMPGDPHFAALYDSLAREDLDAAFEAAHALKGSAANLSLTPLSAPIREITELLRARTRTDYSALIAEIRGRQEELARICGT